MATTKIWHANHWTGDQLKNTLKFGNGHM